MNRYTIRDFKYESDTPMSRLQDLENKVEDGELKEVKHGYWKPNPFFKSIYYCSECGRHIEDGSDGHPIKHFPFCHCGAKMDGERKER